MEFANAKIDKKANVYDGGKVTSRTVYLSDGSRKTLGIMLPGEYAFNTAAAEVMESLGGEVAVLLPGEKEWRSIPEGETFSIPAQSSFKIRVESLFDYCCSYKD